jgi:hypothetical protein
LHPTQAPPSPIVPLRVYDDLFGGKPGAAAEAHAAMVKKYGEKQGNSVFYATVEKKKKAKKKIARPTRTSPRRA